MTKSIAGPAAGQQGKVVIHTVCNGIALTPDFVIPAGAPEGVRSHIYSDVATPASCVVTETADGSTSSVMVDVVGSPGTTTIAPGGAGAVHITDNYRGTGQDRGPERVGGSLLVTKTIAGPRAGHQGRVVIRVTCNGTTRSPDFVIAAKRRGVACRAASTASRPARCARSTRSRTAPPPQSR